MRKRIWFGCATLAVLFAFEVSFAEAQAPQRELLLVTRPGVPEPSEPEVRAFADGVLEHVRQGLNAAIQSEGCRFSGFMTEGQASEQQRQVFEQLRDLAKLTNQDVNAIAAAIQKRFNREEPTAFLYVSVLRVQQTTLVNLALHDIAQGFKVVALKSIEINGEGASDLFQRVLYAARSIAARNPSSQRPEASVSVSPGPQVEAYQSVRLDGSASFDPDMDALAFEWQDEQKRVVSRTKTAVVSPKKSGSHRYSLVVSELVGPNPQWAVAEVELLVRERIAADAGASRIVQGHKSPVYLDARASLPTDAAVEWRQVTGPPVQVRGQGSRDEPAPATSAESQPRCQAWVCEFTPTHNGEYAFEATVAADGRLATSRVAYLVVDPPEAIAGPSEIDAAPGVTIKLERNTSYDSVDAEPEMLWSVVGDNKRYVTLSNPRSRAPTFNAYKPGDYKLQLVVRARRNFNGLKLSDVARDEIIVHVRRPAWTLFANVDTIFADKTRDLLALGLQVALWRTPDVDIGVRWAQAIASVELRGNKKLADRFEMGGGLSVAPAITWHMDLPFGSTDFTAFLGYRYRFAGKGLDLGISASVRLFEHFSILPDLGVEQQLHPDARTDLKAGLGIGYQP